MVFCKKFWDRIMVPMEKVALRTVAMDNKTGQQARPVKILWCCAPDGSYGQ